MTPEQREDRVKPCKEIIPITDADKNFLTKLLLEMRRGVLPMTPKQATEFEWDGETSPQPKKLKFRRSRIKNVLIIFSTIKVYWTKNSYQKKINALFYKWVMDRLLKHIQWLRPAAFCSPDFFLLHDNAPARKAASICQFLTPQKNYNLLSLPVLSRFISHRLFTVPQVENEVNRTKLFGCCWDRRSCN